MAGEAGRAAQGESSNQEFERLDGELDAALVFIAASQDYIQGGNQEFAAICRADATGIYAIVLATLHTASVTRGQLEHLKAKLVRVQHLLAEVRGTGSSAR